MTGKNDVQSAPLVVSLPPNPSVLIILMGSLGDVTRGLCLVPEIKRGFPGGQLTWLIEPAWAEWVAAHPLIDEVLVFDRPNWWKGGLKRVFGDLRQGRFDCVLDLQRHFKSGLFSFLTGAPLRIGFHPQNAKEKNGWFNNTHIPCGQENTPKIQQYLNFLDKLGLPQPARPDFGFSGEGLLTVAAPLLADLARPFVALVLGSTWPTKEWPAERYRQLIREILQTTDLTVALVDAPPKREMAETLCRAAGSPRLVNLVGRTSVPALAGVLQAATVAVGPDCGAGHIAAAVETPYVSLFGPTDPERTAPYGNADRVIYKKPSCAPCYKRHCHRGDLVCMRSIEAAEVKEKIVQVQATGPDQPVSRS